MSTYKRIGAVCLMLALLASVLMLWGQSLNAKAVDAGLGYEQRLFSQDRVHTIDIVMEDWEGFLETCTNEEYSSCNAVIDGETFSGIGIRAKGNTSLSTVTAMDSDRYSFKLEFDQYDKTKSYYGLDKVSLNNFIQDNTMMKDYLTYQLMGKLGAPAPLCSYVYITVNGEDWGLYLAVEAIEESFLQRNYGNDDGQLYKPDVMSNGGDREGGKDFDMGQWNRETPPSNDRRPLSGEALKQALEQQGIPVESLGDVDWDTVTMEELREKLSQLPGMDVQALFGAIMGGGMSPSPMGGSKGSADVKLQYVDDNPDSYSNIFDNAKTDVTDEDKARLIQSLRKLSSGEDLENILDMDSVLRYFVVHTFVCNEDSYTGSMIHNYYLYEQDGRLAMLPWDYNLAFGGFQSRDASSVINASIDNPISGGDAADRPMFGWITSNETYLQQYHRLYEQFLSVLESNEDLAQRTAQLILPYVQKDPTKFCTVEEFEAGTAAMEQFLKLRSESVKQQLAGQGGTVDASSVNLADMGTMHMGGGMERPMNPNQMGGSPFSSPDGGSMERPMDPNQMGRPFGNPGEDGTVPSTAPVQTGTPNAQQPPNLGDRAPGQQDYTLLIIAGSCLLLLIIGLVVAAKLRRKQ